MSHVEGVAGKGEPSIGGFLSGGGGVGGFSGEEGEVRERCVVVGEGESSCETVLQGWGFSG